MKRAISLILFVLLTNLAHCQGDNKVSYKLITGTYPYPGNSDGIYVCDFNTRTADFNFEPKIAGVGNPGYLTVRRKEKHVYAVNEVRNGSGNEVFKN
jgi:6-phosphogluconolactonase